MLKYPWIDAHLSETTCSSIQNHLFNYPFLFLRRSYIFHQKSILLLDRADGNTSVPMFFTDEVIVLQLMAFETKDIIRVEMRPVETDLEM